MFALNLIEPLTYGGLCLILPVPIVLVVLKAESNAPFLVEGSS